MTLAERATALHSFGYTPMQAEFLTSAALTAGCFLPRQYRSHRGKAVEDLCHKVLRNGHAQPVQFAHQQKLYHIKAKGFYAALGEEENKNRRESDSWRLITKVMGLDYVLQHPEYRFLPTEGDKVAYFVGERG